MSALTDYLNRVPSANQTAPKFMAMLSAILQPIVDNINLVDSIPELFDIDTAVGTQLDVVGQWVGLSRMLEAPIPNVYFSLDSATLGLDQGVWYAPFDPTEGVISLDDATYRMMLYIKIAANNWDGSFAQMQAILASIFATSPGTLFFAQDNFDMTITLAIAGDIPSQLFIQLLVQDYLTLRGAAVGIAEVVVTSVDGAPIFGLDGENAYISGLDVGAWGTALA
jgi:uncharacterized protein DUF2612